MLWNYIFLPEGIDLFSTVVWGIVATAVGGILVERFRGTMGTTRIVSSILAILIGGTAVWLGGYNVPAYGHIFLGDLESDCSNGIEQWFKAYEIQPRLGLAYLRIGQCFYKSGNYDLAIKWFDAGQAYEPRVQILNWLGKSYACKSNYELAEQNFREAVILDPKSAEAHFWLGWALYENKHYQEAQPHLQFAIQQNYSVGRAHAGLGFSYMMLKNYSLARQEFSAALAADPNQEDVQKALESIKGR